MSLDLLGTPSYVSTMSIFEMEERSCSLRKETFFFERARPRDRGLDTCLVDRFVMRVVSLQCPSCAASVSPEEKKCESCGSYYAVVEGSTSLLAPAVRLFKSGGQFTFVYGPRKFFLMGRHSRQAHVPVRDKEDIEKLGISRKAALVTFAEIGPAIERIGKSPMRVAMEHGSPRDLEVNERVPLISGMTINFGLKGHVWTVQILETTSGKTGVLFSEPGDRVRHLLVADNVAPARFLGSDAQLDDLGGVRNSFLDDWVPVLMKEAGKSHSFPTECSHVWHP